MQIRFYLIHQNNFKDQIKPIFTQSQICHHLCYFEIKIIINFFKHNLLEKKLESKGWHALIIPEC